MSLFGAPTRRLAIVAATLAIGLITAACQPVTYEPGTSRPWYCDPTDTAVNDGHGAMFEQIYTQPKGPLSTDDCRTLHYQLVEAQRFVAQFPTVADAEAAGWVEAAVWSPGQGIHFVDPARLTGPFDPERPNWLMYDGTSPDSKLTGMMFLVQSGSAPPAGFPGGNDQWHQHHELCVTTVDGHLYIAGEQLTDAECAALGGTNQMFMDIWMVHVWLPTYAGWYADDVFNKVHPLVP